MSFVESPMSARQRLRTPVLLAALLALLLIGAPPAPAAEESSLTLDQPEYTGYERTARIVLTGVDTGDAVVVRATSRSDSVGIDVPLARTHEGGYEGVLAFAEDASRPALDPSQPARLRMVGHDQVWVEHSGSVQATALWASGQPEVSVTPDRLREGFDVPVHMEVEGLAERVESRTVVFIYTDHGTQLRDAVAGLQFEADRLTFDLVVPLHTGAHFVALEGGGPTIYTRFVVGDGYVVTLDGLMEGYPVPAEVRIRGIGTALSERTRVSLRATIDGPLPPPDALAHVEVESPESLVLSVGRLEPGGYEVVVEDAHATMVTPLFVSFSSRPTLWLSPPRLPEDYTPPVDIVVTGREIELEADATVALLDRRGAVIPDAVRDVRRHREHALAFTLQAALDPGRYGVQVTSGDDVHLLSLRVGGFDSEGRQSHAFLDVVPGEVAGEPIEVEFDLIGGPVVVRVHGLEEPTTLSALRFHRELAEEPGLPLVHEDTHALLDTAYSAEVGVDVAGMELCIPYAPDDVEAAGLVEGELRMYSSFHNRLYESTRSHDAEEDRMCGAVRGSRIGGLVGQRRLEPGVEQVAGAGRTETAALLSAAVYPPSPPTTFLATGGSFPDALAAAPVAGRRGGPVLLVGDAPDDAVRAELSRLRSMRLVVLGGHGALPASMEADLDPYLPPPLPPEEVPELPSVGADSAYGELRRVSGADRFGTAALLSAEYFPTGARVVYLATGGEYADALAAGPAAFAERGPLLLTGRDDLHPATAAELARLQPDRIVVLGGSRAVDEAVVAAAESAAGAAAERIAGGDRYATAAAISAHAFETGEIVLIATGHAFPDGLAGSAAAAYLGAPLLLVGDEVSPATAAELRRLAPRRILVLGGAAAVPDEVVAQLTAFVGD